MDYSNQSILLGLWALFHNPEYGYAFQDSIHVVVIKYLYRFWEDKNIWEKIYFSHPILLHRAPFTKKGMLVENIAHFLEHKLEQSLNLYCFTYCHTLKYLWLLIFFLQKS